MLFLSHLVIENSTRFICHRIFTLICKALSSFHRTGKQTHNDIQKLTLKNCSPYQSVSLQVLSHQSPCSRTLPADSLVFTSEIWAHLDCNSFSYQLYTFSTGILIWPHTLCRPGWPQSQISACLYLPIAGTKGAYYHIRLFVSGFISLASFILQEFLGLENEKNHTKISKYLSCHFLSTTIPTENTQTSMYNFHELESRLPKCQTL